jgi:hypothetical protein
MNVALYVCTFTMTMMAGPQVESSRILELGGIRAKGGRKRKGRTAMEEAGIRRGKGHIYKIDNIVDHKRSGKSWVFCVKWLGYPPEDKSWEPDENITYSALQEYWRKVNGKSKVSTWLSSFLRCLPVLFCCYY